MNTNAIDRYCRKIKRRLVCSKKTKEILISGLRDEIENKGLPENVTFQWLEDEIGKPAEIVEELQDSVDKDEYQQARKNRLLVLTAAIVFSIGVLIAGFKWYVDYVRENEVGYVETIIVVEGEDDEFINSLPEITDVDYKVDTSIE